MPLVRLRAEGRPLVGRGEEIERLAHILDEARNERGGALVLRGEAGVGKTALLDHAVDHAEGFHVARVLGVESETELPYAALHQLCWPMLDRLDRLPAPQRAALEVAFGLSTGSPPESLLVGLAVLSLLSDQALEQPLLCVADDAQWLDRASAQALAFVARRLLADRVALLFATRKVVRELTGIPDLVVRGLPDGDARALLASATEGPLDERVRERIVAEADGNPLALLELSPSLDPAEPAFAIGGPGALPVPSRIEESFQRRVEALPGDTQQLLLLAALESLGDPARLWAAAEQLGIARSAAEHTGGLLDVGESVRFRHPLVRSAVYRAAGPPERREAHRALAAVIDAELDPDRRAWHLAQAATRPDEELAGELERSAGRAQERGGLSAAGAFLELSAKLTPDDQRQAMRRLMAAGTHLMAGANERAQELLAQTVPDLDDPAARAVALRIEGAIRFADGRGGDTPALLYDAAMALRDASPALARESLMESMEAAMWAGRLTSSTTTVDVARAAAAIGAPDDDTAPASLLLTGYTKLFVEGYPAAVPCWRRAFDAFDAELEVSPHSQWHGMIWNATGETLDFAAHASVARRWARLAREQGALATLAVALSGLGWCEMLAGRVQAAESLLYEALDISAATGGPAVPGGNEILRMGILDWRGHDEAAVLGDAIIAEAGSRGQGLGVTIAKYGRTIFELGHGRYERACSYALEVFEEDVLYFATINLADVIEATVRSGDVESANAALARLTERAEATMTPWGLGLLSRGRALLAGDADAEAHYVESVAHLERSGVEAEHARSRLVYGEWLRRQRRRRDARIELRAAHDMLQASGVDAFANRARVELLATGEQARARVAETRDQLTPHERHIALLAAEGQTNAEIGAQLFISPHTVAYHLRKLFRKLGISSRRQLAAAIAEPLGTSTA
jgi:DNA-binding CsgD family transcriptional regulator